MKVSIITVSYNSAATIEKTILSVINQDYRNIEYIVIDGGSTDGTHEIIEAYASHIQYWVSEADNGIYDAMNKGINKAEGDIISIINSDDFFQDNSIISSVVDVFEKNNVKAVFTSIHIVDKEDEVVRYYSIKNFYDWMIRFGIAPPHPGAFISSDIYIKYGLYDLRYKIGADFDFFARIINKEGVSYKKLDINSVAMLEGGVSSNGFKSYKQSSKDIYSSLIRNQIHTSQLFVWLRLPMKFVLHLWIKYQKNSL